jgi:hypothetical protein
MILNYHELAVLLNEYKKYLLSKGIPDPYAAKVPSLEHFNAKKFKPSNSTKYRRYFKD